MFNSLERKVTKISFVEFECCVFIVRLQYSMQMHTVRPENEPSTRIRLSLKISKLKLFFIRILSENQEMKQTFEYRDKNHR